MDIRQWDSNPLTQIQKDVGVASFVLGRAMPGSPYHMTGLNIAENKMSGTGWYKDGDRSSNLYCFAF